MLLLFNLVSLIQENGLQTYNKEIDFYFLFTFKCQKSPCITQRYITTVQRPKHLRVAFWAYFQIQRKYVVNLKQVN